MPNQPTTPPTDTELRYGFGTAQAITSFFKTLTDQRELRPIILAVNISTLLRNSIGTVAFVDGQKIENKEARSLNVQGVVEKTRAVMIDIANELAQIVALKGKEYKHHVLFYLTDPFKQVAKEWIRPQTSEAAIKLQTVTQWFTRIVKSEDQESGNTSMHIRLADQMRVPSYKGIADVLGKFARYDVDVHLISHMPLDYHVTNYSGRKGFLYRSHTGEIVKLDPATLGKTVFKEPDVPFYPCTHVLLGDKYLIKGCLPRKEKERFIELCKANHWNVRTNDYMVSKISEYNFHPSFRIG